MEAERRYEARINTLSRRLVSARSDGDNCRAVLECDGELATLLRDGNGALVPHRCGVVLESLIAARAGARRKHGAFYTPPWLVSHLLDVCLDPALDELCSRLRGPGRDRALGQLTVCDPACGSGNFLLPAAERIARRAARLSLDDVLCNCIFGVDINADAAALCRSVLISHAKDHGLVRAALERSVLAGDALHGRWPGGESRGQGVDWECAFRDVFARGGFGVVVGNPPFLNQLESATAGSREQAGLLRSVSGGMISGYADAAAAFLLLASRVVRPEGRFAMVLPRALLSSRDGGALRAHLAGAHTLEHLWVADEHVFAASVYTCVVSCRRRATVAHEIARSGGVPAVRASEVRIGASELAESTTWSALCADMHGVPPASAKCEGVIGDIASATADFRDEYYGLDGFIVDTREADDAEFPRLVTTGLVDLARLRWGEVATRVLKRAWSTPRLDLARMKATGALGEWAQRRLVRKVLFATQTRALECVVDESGSLLPVTPLVSVTPRSPRALWKLGAALGSPVLSVIAARTYGGAALHADAIKLSAKQVALLPLPRGAEWWSKGASSFRAASRAKSDDARALHLKQFAAYMLRAYAIPTGERRAILRWWSSRALGPKRQPKAFL